MSRSRTGRKAHPYGVETRSAPQSIAEPLLHTAPLFKSPSDIERYVQHLREHPERGQHNRVLTATGSISSIPTIPWPTPNLRVAYNVLPHIPQSSLTMGLVPQPLPSLVWLRLNCGDTNLRKGHGIKGTLTCTRECLDATFFHGLPNLKYLSICGCVVGPSPIAPLVEVLPRLEEVHLSVAGGSCAIEALTAMA